MLWALKDDGQVSAGDLSNAAGVAPSTASEHLAKLSEAGLVAMTRAGRMRYYRLSGPEIADQLEGLEALARKLAPARMAAETSGDARCHSRTCLDHLAGSLGGRLAGAMAETGLLRHTADGPELTKIGNDWLRDHGADPDGLVQGPRRLIGLCRDWSFELPHIGGAVGAAMLTAFLAGGWLRRGPARGQLLVTPKGASGFRKHFGIDARHPG